jgi:uncharacterized membrane protein
MPADPASAKSADLRRPFAWLLVLALAMPSCAKTSPSPSAPAASFVNKVWQVKQSTSVATGDLYAFLSDGTLVMASPHSKPALGSWTYEDSILTMVEDGIPYTTDILALSDSVFSIRSHNPGHPVDIILAPADQPPPASIRAAVSAAFLVPHAELGQLSALGARLEFRSCVAGSPAKEVTDLPSADAKTLIRDLGGGKPIPVLVRLDGQRVREIRYAGPSEVRCDKVLSEGELEAKGNEPFWSADVDHGEVVVRTPEQQAGVRYGNGFWTRPGPDHWIFQASRQDQGQVARLKLEITETLCFDSMSGARYPFRAVLDRDGARVTGCALEGRNGMAR